MTAVTSDDAVDSLWSAALKKAMSKFKDYQSSSSTFPIIERIRIEEIKILGTATIIVAVKPRTYLLFILTRLYSLMRVDGITFPIETRYRLSVRDDGDIAEIKKLEESFVRQYVRSQPTVSTPKDELILREIKSPVSELKYGKLRVTVTFVAENIGNARKVHPVVQYKIARLANGKFQEESITSSDDWILDLGSNTIQPISFSMDFDDVNIVILTKPPHRISVKLITVH